MFTEEQIKTDDILKYFKFDHLPPHLQTMSKKFAELALYLVVEAPRSPERTIALRKILEGKDAGVRAILETKKIDKVEQKFER